MQQMKFLHINVAEHQQLTHIYPPATSGRQIAAVCGRQQNAGIINDACVIDQIAPPRSSHHDDLAVSVSQQPVWKLA